MILIFNYTTNIRITHHKWCYNYLLLHAIIEFFRQTEWSISIHFIINFPEQQVNGNNHDSSSTTTSSSAEPTPPDNLAPPTHQRLTASASAPLQDSNLSGGYTSLKTDLYTTKSNLQQGTTSSNTASPTKCILNNHKMEERRRYTRPPLLY